MPERGLRDVDVKIDIEEDKLRDDLGRFLKGIPDIEHDTAEIFAEDLEDEIKNSVDRKFGNFEGNLKNNVAAEPRSSDSTGVAFEVSANAYNDGVNYAAWHEYAEEGHYAYYKTNGSRNRELIRWAKMKGLYDKTWRLKVTPINQQEGSFMEPAIDRAIKQLRRRLSGNRSKTNEAMDRTFGGR